jgi:hypothetical protein
MFPIALWNIHDRVSMSLPRTNNSIEGWHNAFAKRVAVAHPIITKLTDRIRREQSKFEIDVVQIPQGHEPKLKTNKYRLLDDHLSTDMAVSGRPSCNCLFLIISLSFDLFSVLCRFSIIKLVSL